VKTIILGQPEAFGLWLLFSV